MMGTDGQIAARRLLNGVVRLTWPTTISLDATRGGITITPRRVGMQNRGVADRATGVSERTQFLMATHLRPCSINQTERPVRGNAYVRTRTLGRLLWEPLLG